ncbi:MAG: hypothetical protein ACLR3S_07595 [Clostridium fessum]
MILDTVHGRIRQIRNHRMDENPHYGELAKESVASAPMFNFLQVEEYLFSRRE